MKIRNNIVFALLIAMLPIGVCARNTVKKKVQVNTSSSEGKELPGGPEDVPSKIIIGEDGKSFSLSYNGGIILEGTCSRKVEVSSEVHGEGAIEQQIKLQFRKSADVTARVHGREMMFEAMANLRRFTQMLSRFFASPLPPFSSSPPSSVSSPSS